MKSSPHMRTSLLLAVLALVPLSCELPTTVGQKDIPNLRLVNTSSAVLKSASVVANKTILNGETEYKTVEWTSVDGADGYRAYSAIYDPAKTVQDFVFVRYVKDDAKDPATNKLTFYDPGIWFEEGKIVAYRIVASVSPDQEMDRSSEIYLVLWDGVGYAEFHNITVYNDVSQRVDFKLNGLYFEIDPGRKAVVSLVWGVYTASSALLGFSDLPFVFPCDMTFYLSQQIQSQFPYEGYWDSDGRFHLTN